MVQEKQYTYYVVELISLCKDNLQGTMESTYRLDYFRYLPLSFYFRLSSAQALFLIP